MRIPDEICDSVVFVGRSIQKGSLADRRPLGTAFAISVPAEGDKNAAFLYFVTAKHVANSLSLGGPWFLRANMKDGETTDIMIDEPPRWLFHPKEPDTTDVAVAAIGVPWDEMSHKLIPVSMLATDETIGKYSIGRGDIVFISGCSPG
jgi:hypothetical protein